MGNDRLLPEEGRVPFPRQVGIAMQVCNQVHVAAFQWRVMLNFSEALAATW